VWYLDQFWDPASQQFMQRPRLEENLDRTNTWGLHFAYEQPLPGAGWRIGGIATVNRMDHPKIPNYAIMNIPRDPGNSSAFNIGIGLGRTDGVSSFGLDLIYEPIWSHTWADAAEPIQTLTGRTIPAGGMTIENRFRFSNALLRTGVGQDVVLGTTGPVAELQLGLSIRRIHYWLEQENHIQLSSRDHEEAWVEWTPTWGLNLGFTNFDLRYQGSVTHGTGRPGIVQQPGILEADVQLASNILVAPSGPLTLSEVRVITHQISLSLPIR
jgi:hypothetical protein